MYVAFRPMIIRILRMPRGHRRYIKLNVYISTFNGYGKNKSFRMFLGPDKKDILKYIRKIILAQKEQNK